MLERILGLLRRPAVIPLVIVLIVALVSIKAPYSARPRVFDFQPPSHNSLWLWSILTSWRAIVRRDYVFSALSIRARMVRRVSGETLEEP